MDYGNVLSRAWTIVWQHKWLILLGVLVALGSSSGGGSSGANAQFSPGRDGFDFRVPEFDRDLGVPTFLIVAVLLVIFSVAVVVGLVLWVVATIARGGLIAAVDAIDAGASSTFVAAWNAGWRKGWRLIGIGILPAIPALILLILGLGATGLFVAMLELLGDGVGVAPRAGLGLVWVTLICIFVPIALVLSLLQAFANRACMLEDAGVIAAYRRGVTVLFENIGPAVILFLLQILMSVVLGVAMFLPGLVMVLCCILWPLLILIRGAVSAYFSTMWTLAWREWTGPGHPGEIVPAGGGMGEA
ncbi:MAG: DUF7544 domain-containing protein [Chloroflexota bacterium]